MARPLVLWLFMLALVPNAWPDDLRPLPPVLRSVSDSAGVLTPSQGRELATFLDTIRKERGIRVIVLIETTTAPEEIEDYLHRLAERWRTQKSLDLSRAVFVVLAVDDRALRVACDVRGSPLNASLSDGSITADLAELFKDARYFEGLMTLARRISEAVARQGART